jgi:hypothetical protein
MGMRSDLAMMGFCFNADPGQRPFLRSSLLFCSNSGSHCFIERFAPASRKPRPE